MLSKPERKGYVLTEWGEDMYSEWQDIGGCSCHLGGAPCQSCTHEGNPISLEENDEAWELDLPKENQFWRKSYTLPWVESLSKEDRERFLFGEWKTEEGMSRSEIVNKSTTKDSPKVSAEPMYNVGDEVRVLRDTNGSGLSFGEIVRITGQRCYNEHAGKYYYPTNRGKNVREDDVGLVVLNLDKKEEKVDSFKTLYAYKPEDVRVFIDGKEINPNSSSVSNSINPQEESNMTQVTNRKTVTVNLIDRDSALDEKYSLVAAFGEFVTSKSPEALIRSIMIDPENDVAGAIEAHNELRVGQVDKDILKRTGNKVMLEPIEESDLYWEIL